MRNFNWRLLTGAEAEFYERARNDRFRLVGANSWFSEWPDLEIIFKYLLAEAPYLDPFDAQKAYRVARKDKDKKK